MAETIHDRIGRLRADRGWSKAELGRRVATAEGHPKTPISYQTIQQWENGASAPKRKRLESVAKVFGITASELAHGSPDRILSSDLRELEDCWPHLTSTTRERFLKEAREEAVNLLSRNNETLQKLMKRASTDARVEQKLGLPSKKKPQTTK